MEIMKLFCKKNLIAPTFVESVMDFNSGSSVEAKSMKKLQNEGTAGIYNILCKEDAAYLADEVGLGKTYQALGLCALVWNLKPDARIAVIAPRENLQKKWRHDYLNYISNCYKHEDDIVKSTLTNSPTKPSLIISHLRHFADALHVDRRRLFLLRHTSFSRPIMVNDSDYKKKTKDVWGGKHSEMKSHGVDITRFSTSDVDQIRQNNKKLSWYLNRSFGQGFNKLLAGINSENRPFFDLVIVDEAQYLRNDNQGNTVFSELFRGQVAKWLLVSATPIHSGMDDVPNVLERCLGNKRINTKCIMDAQSLKAAMKPFTIRRSRAYFFGDAQAIYKTSYRVHREEENRFRMVDPEHILTMAIVQKYLAKIMKSRNNHFRIGCLSSFESLSASVIRAAGPRYDPVENAPKNIADLHISNDEIGEVKNTDLMDADFVKKLAENYQKQFKVKIPHPKIDKVCEDVYKEVNTTGNKILIFTRRINTVNEIVGRLNHAFESDVEKRIQRLWGLSLDSFSLTLPNTEKKSDEESEQENIDNELPQDEFKSKIAKLGEQKRPLAIYRRSFRGSGKRALYFEHNWFRYLSSIYNTSIDQIANEIPDELWAEREEFGRKGYDGKPTSRLRQYRYIITQTVLRFPEVLGIPKTRRKCWQVFFSERYRNESKKIDTKRNPKKDTSYIYESGFWNNLYSGLKDKGTHTAIFKTLHKGTTTKELLLFDIASAVAAQRLRYSDIILDIYGAIEQSKKSINFKSFHEYFLSDEFDAIFLRKEITEWFKHIELIINNSFNAAGISLGEIAWQDGVREMQAQRFCLGISGNTGINQTALQQFKTPGYPKVMVCTDILKEGEDLHIFCDRIVHYGVAWTSGDLEQRVGRVDRYFSRLERQITQKGDKAKLYIDYPSIYGTIEVEQNIRVLDRVKKSEAVLEDLGGRPHNEEKILSLDTPIPKSEIKRPPVNTGKQQIPHNYFEPDFHKRKSTVFVKKRESGMKDEIINIQQQLEKDLLKDPSCGHLFESRFRLNYKTQCTIHCTWEFIGDLGIYALKMEREDISGIPDVQPKYSVGEYFDRQYRKYHRVYVSGGYSVDYFSAAVKKSAELLEDDTRLSNYKKFSISKLIKILKEKTKRSIDATKLRPNKFELNLQFGVRGQIALLYVYNDLYIVSSPIVMGEGLCDFIGCKQHDKVKEISRQWCMKENRDVKLGYYHYHENDNSIRLSERVFSVTQNGDLDLKFLAGILKEIAWQADLYEAKLTGGKDLL